MKINENVFNKELHFFASSAGFKGKAEHLKYAHAHTQIHAFPVSSPGNRNAAGQFCPISSLLV